MSLDPARAAEKTARLTLGYGMGASTAATEVRERRQLMDAHLNRIRETWEAWSAYHLRRTFHELCGPPTIPQFAHNWAMEVIAMEANYGA